MPSPRLLVIEGNSPETWPSTWPPAARSASKGYAELLRELLPGAVVDICFPGDPGANLPNGRRWKAMTASPSPARACMSMTAGRR